MSKSQIVLLETKSGLEKLFAVRLPKVCAYRKEQFASLSNLQIAASRNVSDGLVS
jgi:hypothetical protein